MLGSRWCGVGTALTPAGRRDGRHGVRSYIFGRCRRTGEPAIEAGSRVIVQSYDAPLKTCVW